MSTRPYNSKRMRARLIESALSTIQTHGIVGLTLDAVARQAGVSKGGLLHHFPSKETLTEAILITLLERFTMKVESFYTTETSGTGRWLRAYVRASLDDSDPLPLEIIPILASALTENQTLAAYLQRDIAEWRARLMSDGVATARADVIRYAADNFWQARLIEGNNFSAENCTALLEELMRLTQVES